MREFEVRVITGIGTNYYHIPKSNAREAAIQGIAYATDTSAASWKKPGRVMSLNVESTEKFCRMYPNCAHIIVTECPTMGRKSRYFVAD